MSIQPKPELKAVPTPDDSLHMQPSDIECKRCSALERELAKERRQAKARERILQRYVDRLTNALQRESHHIDVRTPHDGKQYIDRHR